MDQDFTIWRAYALFHCVAGENMHVKIPNQEQKSKMYTGAKQMPWSLSSKFINGLTVIRDMDKIQGLKPGEGMDQGVSILIADDCF